MATYTAVTAGEKDADSPITVSLIDKLDQNPHAIAEGATGAPKVQTAGLNDGAVTLSKMATDSVNQSKLTNDSVGQGEIIANSVGQSELKEATSDTSLASITNDTTDDIEYVSAGGGFVLSEQFFYTVDGDCNAIYLIRGTGQVPGSSTTADATITTGGVSRKLGIVDRSGKFGTAPTIVFRDVYVTASPPYNIGSLDWGPFIYILLDDSGNPKSYWYAIDPPFAHNGPTRTMPDRIDKTGKKYINKLILPDNYDTLDVKSKALEYAKASIEEIELTSEIKNADINLIPHPFSRSIPENRILMLEPTGKAYQELSDAKQKGFDISEIIFNGYLKLNENSGAPQSNKPINTTLIKTKWKN